MFADATQAEIDAAMEILGIQSMNKHKRRKDFNMTDAPVFPVVEPVSAVPVVDPVTGVSSTPVVDPATGIIPGCRYSVSG